MKIMYKNVFWLLFLLTSNAVFAAHSNLHQLDISRNEFGLNPKQMTCIYNSISDTVICRPEDPYAPNAPETKTFNKVYVRKLTSDPAGLNFLGTFPNPGLNPGPISEYTSTNPIHSIYTSKY